MKTKQIITLVAILIIGILIGKFAFSNIGTSATNTDSHKNETVEEHWTCSMHPQIDMPEPGQCPICGMDLIPKVAGSDDGLSQNAFKMTKNAVALANIETIIIGNEKVSNKNTSFKFSGKIQANDNESAIQTAHFGGRIEKLYFKSLGDYVKEGSLVASVYSPALVTAQNELLEAMKVKELQPELYNAVRNKIKLWKISEKQIQEIEHTKKVITNFKMYASVSGYIDQFFVQEGNHVKEGASLFKVSKLQTVWAVFDVYEQDVKKLKLGQNVEIAFNAYPDVKVNAKIDFINPVLNVKTRTVEVRATIKNKNTFYKPGMLIVGNVSLHKKATKNTLLVPKTAVMWTGKRSVVYMKDKNEPIFELREVSLGATTGNFYEILSGLKEGEEIVSNGTFTIDAAAQLLGKKSMMSPKEASDNNTKKVYKKIAVNPIFVKQLNVVIDDYIDLKNSLVVDNAKKVTALAKKALSNLSKVEMKLLKKPEAHTVWMDLLPKLKKSFTAISQENNIENQRKEFITLSENMINLASVFGVTKTLFVTHCPMANNNKGANWLSEIKEVKNPFFGSKMLTCGNVEKTLSKK